MLAFYRDNARWLLAAMLLTYGSGFGQTFFIALFAGDIRHDFALSHGQWAQIYATGTLASAAVMLVLGSLVDRLMPARITLGVVAGFVVACLGMAGVSLVLSLSRDLAIVLLTIVIFGLRLCGQGMMGHLSMVFIGRWFARNRGKGAAVSGLGFSLGEASLPVVFVAFSLALGWQLSWIFAAFVLALLGVVTVWLLQRSRRPRSSQSDDSGEIPGMGGRHWQRRDLWSSGVFWVALLGMLTHPMFSTVLFFQIVPLTTEKGWSLVEFSALFPLYTVSSLLAMFLVGNWVDRFGVARFLPFFMLPMALGLAIMSWGQELYWAAFALMLHGVMQGSGTSISGTFWAEYFGTRHLGAIRAVTSGAMVLSTALGPLISGYLLDHGIDFVRQLQGMSLYTVLACVVLLAMALVLVKKHQSGDHD